MTGNRAQSPTLTYGERAVTDDQQVSAKDTKAHQFYEFVTYFGYCSIRLDNSFMYCKFRAYFLRDNVNVFNFLLIFSIACDKITRQLICLLDCVMLAL